MSGGGSKNTTQTTRVEYSPEEQAARNKIMQEALGTYEADKNDGSQQYSGAKPVNFGANTLLGQQMAIQNAQQQGAQLQQTQQANNFGLHDALYAESNPYLQSAMTAATRPMIEQFSEAGGALSGIRQDAMQSGGYGGSRQGIAEGLAAKALQNKVADTRSTMAYQGYKDGLDQQQAAIKNQAMLTMLSQIPAQTVGQVGAMEDAKGQEWANYEANRAQYEGQQQWQPLQNLANIIYGGSNGTTTSTAAAPKPDNTMATLGGLGQLAMMALMF
jgi:hypothetical protein